MAKSPEEMAASMIANLKEKTGRSLPEWKKELASQQDAKHGVLLKHIKSSYGVSHGFANLIAHKVRASDAQSIGGADDLVAAQYAKAKEHLRPIYDKVTAIVQAFGDDVESAPKKAYVSYRRKKQFALIQPSTKSRVDVGINLKDVEADGRLEKSGSFNAMVSHRVRLAAVEDVDAELEGWLQAAYERA